MSEPSFPDTARSRHVLARFAFKLVIAASWALAQVAFGALGFARGLLAMCFVFAVLSATLAVFQRDRVSARHFTYFDEACWFFLICHIVRSLA